MNDEQYKYIETPTVRIVLPKCCEEASDDCPHVPKKKREKKRNIAL